MKYRLFTGPESIWNEVDEMERLDMDKRFDRSTVSSFFHGAPPYSDSQAEALGLTVNVNNLFGFEHLTAGRDQLLSLYNTPSRLFEIQLQEAPASKKQEWEMKATAAWNRIMKRTNRLKIPYEFAAGDATMHGEGFLWNPSPTDWALKHCSLARRLVPEGATLDVSELTHFAVLAPMPFRDLIRFYETSTEGWNKANLKALLGRIFKKQEGTDGYSAEAKQAIDTMNPELLEYYRQNNPSLDRAWSYSAPVAYFYQVNFNSPNRSLSLTVLSKDLTSATVDQKKQSILYQCEDCEIPLEQSIFPLHMNCVVGGEPLWSRVKGLGHLNYSLSWHLEVLMDRCIQAAHEQATTFFQAADSASREAMEQILLKHNGIIPDGITLIQGREGSDFNGLLAMIQSLRQQASTNANTIAPNNGSGTDELAIQAAFRQNLVGTASTNRVVNWFNYMERIGAHIFSRFTNQLLQPQDKGYSEIMEFQAAMMRERVPLESLQPENVMITPARVVGDGVRQKAVASSQALMEKIELFGPEAQQEIKRMYAAVAMDDYTGAERLVPYVYEPDGSQVLDAETENNVFAVQGKAMKVRDRDVDETHIQVHFDYMASVLKKAMQLQQSTFTPDQAEAFKAAGAHVYLHIQKVGALNPDLQKRYMDDLNNVAAMGQKCANNLAQQQQQQQQTQQIDPIKQAEIQLKIGAQELQREKADFNREKFGIQQSHREELDANRLALEQSRASLEERRAKLQDMLSDVETSLRVRDSVNAGE